MSSPLAEPIAIVGSACHFAGDVTSPSKLWELLRDPQDVRREIPDSRFSAKGFHHHHHAQPGHSDVMHSYLLDEDISAFDAEFFGIKPVEAKAVDPQQRWLMETVYEVGSFPCMPWKDRVADVAGEQGTRGCGLDRPRAQG